VYCIETRARGSRLGGFLANTLNLIDLQVEMPALSIHRLLLQRRRCTPFSLPTASSGYLLVGAYIGMRVYVCVSIAVTPAMAPAAARNSASGAWPAASQVP
jgi:hypothetical protein